MVCLFEWTNLYPRNTGLPVTIWVSVHGSVATDPRRPGAIEHEGAVSAWIALNLEPLLAHWSGEIDGAEMASRARKLA